MTESGGPVGGTGDPTSLGELLRRDLSGEGGTSDAAYFAAASRAFGADVAAATGQNAERAAALAAEAEQVFKSFTENAAIAPDVGARLDADLEAAEKVELQRGVVMLLARKILRAAPRNACIAAALTATNGRLTATEIGIVADEILRRRARRSQLGSSAVDHIRNIAEGLAGELEQAACVARRQAFANAAKTVVRRTAQAAAPSPTLGIKAGLVGVDARFSGSGDSVAAAQRANEHDLLGSLDYDLRRAGLDKYARSGMGDANLAEELAALNQGDGRPGLTRDTRAREIASVLHKYQVAARETVIRAGGWITAIDGSVAQDIHDPDRIRGLGPNDLLAGRFPSADEALEAWSQFVFDHADLDLTFGGHDAAREALPRLWVMLVRGPAQADLASGVPVIRWKSIADWLAYNRRYGAGTVAAAVTSDLRRSARRAGLLQILGSDPAKALESDLLHWQIESGAALALRRCLNRVAAAQSSSVARLISFEHLREPGSRSGQSVAIDALAIKIAGIRHRGAPFLDHWRTMLMRALPPGANDRVVTAELLRSGVEARIGHMIGSFAPETVRPGLSSAIEHQFFQWTGHSSLTDGQRLEIQALVARWIGMLKDRSFDALPQDLSAALVASGFDGASWDLLRSGDWALGGDDFFLPDLVDAIELESLAADGAGRSAESIGEELRARILAFTQEYGIHMLATSAADASMPLRRAARILGEIKSMPVAMLQATWGRELFGRDSSMGKLAGVSELIVASLILGYAWLALKDIGSERELPDPAEPSVIAAALLAGGGVLIHGDFLFGSFARFGDAFEDMVHGPTFGKRGIGLPELKRLWLSGPTGMEQAFRVLQENARGENLWLSSELLDFLIVHRIQEALHPDYVKRAESSMKLQNRGKWWLQPNPSRIERTA